MTRNTIIKDDAGISETRYFISSLPLDVHEIARAIRGHWMVESHHWHLDVTFREDDNHTIEKQAAFNLNIIRKLALSVLKIFEVGKKSLSLRMKRFAIGTNPEKHLKIILNLRRLKFFCPLRLASLPLPCVLRGSADCRYCI